MKFIIFLISLSLITILIYSCGSSTSTRYEKKEDKVEKKETDKKAEIVEDFDINPYRTKIEIKEKEKSDKIDLNPWYGYEDDSLKGSEDSSSEIIMDSSAVSTTNGYRVEVMSTDDLEEANSIRSEIYFKTNQKAVYIIFDPPFYKVQAGDFIKREDANQLLFKLNQMGYTSARVIQEMVNVYQ